MHHSPSPAQLDTQESKMPRLVLDPVRSQLRPEAEDLNDLAVDGAFGGSFAGPAAQGLYTEADSIPWYRRRSYFVDGWTDEVVWRSAFVECIATACMVYISAQFGVTLMNHGITQVVAYVGIFSAILLSTFIYATASATGGHMNPMITFTTILCGLTPVSRGTILIAAQTLGGAMAGGLILGSLGRDRATAYKGGGNFFDPDVISPGQVLLIETISGLTVLILAIGNGLDPRRQALYGHRLGPLLVGLSVGLVLCAGTGLAPGYTGPGLNPTRGLALAIAGNHWQNHWVWWVGPALGSILSAAMYNFAPPSFIERNTKKRLTSVA
ncbi:aquaporin-like protein [Rhypophila sp. PSN 637]